jgi:hypothetical protein
MKILVNDLQDNSRCLFWGQTRTNKYILVYICWANNVKPRGIKVKVNSLRPRSGVEAHSTLSLTSALDGNGQRQAPTALPPGKRQGNNRIGGWVGPRTGLDGCGKSRRANQPVESRCIEHARPAYSHMAHTVVRLPTDRWSADAVLYHVHIAFHTQSQHPHPLDTATIKTAGRQAMRKSSPNLTLVPGDVAPNAPWELVTSSLKVFYTK